MRKLLLLPLVMIFCLETVGQLVKGDPGKPDPGIHFIPNKGQIGDEHNKSREDVLFSAQVQGMSVHLRDKGISYQQYRTRSRKAVEDHPLPGFTKADSAVDELTIYRTDMQWLGINPGYRIERGKELPGVTHYYLASCPEGVTNVKPVESVTYHEIYSGIDLKYYNKDGRLEYDFILQVGADPRQIRWKIEGADKIEINKAGEMVITTPLGEIHEQAPFALQGDKIIKAGWRLDGKEVSFKLGPYDPSQPLTIDPVVRQWGTYFGGTDKDRIESMAIDPGGNIIVGGFTGSFPSIATSGAHQTNLSGGLDAFVAKFDSTGSRLWATYYGGASSESARSVAVDGAGNIFLTGSTSSTTGIATGGTHQTSPASTSDPDAFLAKLDNNGIRLWGTYYGGPAYDNCHAVAVDGNGDAYIGGSTSSPSGISTAGAFQSSYAGPGSWGGAGAGDIFLAKFNGNSGNLQWGTYFGGASGSEAIQDIAVDPVSGDIYITGGTDTDTGMATTGTHQLYRSGITGDGYLACFSSSGVRLWSTYYGGPWDDGLISVTADEKYIYVCGRTVSYTGIATALSHQDTLGGGTWSGDGDAYLGQFNKSGMLLWGTYYGGAGHFDAGNCVASDSEGVYMVGDANNSMTNIATPGSHQTVYGGSARDAYAVRFDTNGVRQWGTYYGGTGFEGGYACAISGSGSNKSLYVGGETASTSPSGVIATPGTHQPIFGGGQYDAFIAKLIECDITRDTISVTAYCAWESISSNHTWTAPGTYNDTLTNVRGCDSILTINLTITQGAPVITSTTPGSRCDSGTVTLHATPSRGTVEWYADSSGTVLLGTGSSFVTPPIAVTTIFYAGAVDSNCAVLTTPVMAEIMPHTFAIMDTTVCFEYKSPSGEIYTSSGTYFDAIQNAAGCDSVMQIEVTMEGIEAIVTQQGADLISNGLPDDFRRWVDCEDTTDIPGADGRVYTPSKAGSYAVRLNHKDCVSLSGCYNFILPGIEQAQSRFFSAFPNPTDGHLTIVMDRTYREVTIGLLNMQGQLLRSWQRSDVQTIELHLEEQPGPYVIDVTTAQGHDQYLLINRP